MSSEADLHAGTAVAIDIGQSGMRLSAGGEVRSFPAGIVALTSSEDVTRLAALLVSRIGEAPFETVSISMTGYTVEFGFPAALARQVAVGTGAARVLVMSDVLASYLGSIGLRPGVVVICGTGTVALGWDGGTTARRVDGRGYLLGDHGSGFWIGRRGLQAALDYREGRGGSATLAAAAAQLGTTEQIYRDSFASPSPQQYLAAFAPEVITAADAGDGIARGILADAADEIVRTILAAQPAPRAIGLTGGLVRARRFRTELLSRLPSHPEPVVQPDAGLDGALVAAHRVREVLRGFSGLVTLEGAS